jgi:chaperonin cofactor prefoldin
LAKENTKKAVKEVVQEAVETKEVQEVEVPEILEVKLAVENPNATHTVYTKVGSVLFVDGVANVSKEIHEELKLLGIV